MSFFNCIGLWGEMATRYSKRPTAPQCVTLRGIAIQSTISHTGTKCRSMATIRCSMDFTWCFRACV